MFYTCTRCRYTFTASSLPPRCPDCGARIVRKWGTVFAAVVPASEKEIEEYKENHKEAG